MVYINIPYVAENNRIDKDFVKKEIGVLAINESAKQDAFAAIYHLHPRGVDFSGDQSNEASLLEETLKRLGVPYRKSEESEYHNRE
jgi:hypothetical protein